MENKEYENLLYRRQFLLTGKKIEGLSNWKKYSMRSEAKTLYVHPELDCITAEDERRRIVFLGYVFDWQNPEYDNEKILHRVFEKETFEEILEATFEYSGRFAILYEDEHVCRMFHDAGSQREIYYHVGERGVSCAAQLPIMEKFIGVEETDDKEALELYMSEEFVNSKKYWIGEKTIYKDVKRLRSNFYLDIKDGNAVRYWPLKPIDKKSLEWVSEKGANMLKGFIEAANMRRKLVIPVTAGWDTRIILAASKGIRDDVRYFIIKFPWMDNNHSDIVVPGRLMSKLGCRFEVMESGEHVDEEFEVIFRKNTAYYRLDNLLGIYNVLYNEFSDYDYLNITGHVSEVARNYRGTIKNPNGRLFSTYVGYDGSDSYIVKMCQKWIDENAHVAKDMDVDMLSLFYWEEGLGWEASHRTESDIAIDEYCPFSCRKLLELMLSVESSYRNKYSCTLYQRIMEKLWPEVLSEPINPSCKNTIKGVLVNLDWLYPLKRFVKKL